MNEEVIQRQINLVGFKATKVIIETRSRSGGAVEPKFNIDLKNLTVKDNDKIFVKVFFIDLTTILDDEEVSYKIEFHTVFQCQDKVDETFLKSEFAAIAAPAIGFPFLRSFISTLSLQSGLPPVILPAINFVQLNKHLSTNQSVATNPQ